MMMAVVEMRRHFLLSIWSRCVAVNWDLPDREAIFSMIHIGFLDGAAENLEPQSTTRNRKRTRRNSDSRTLASRDDFTELLCSSGFHLFIAVNGTLKNGLTGLLRLAAKEMAWQKSSREDICKTFWINHLRCGTRLRAWSGQSD
jgi:hypothetical protein